MSDLLERLKVMRDGARVSERHLMADTLCDAIRVIEDYERMLDTREYALAVRDRKPDMSGRERYLFVSRTRFQSAEQADAARQEMPLADVLIVSRIAPVGDWEECDE